MARYSRLEVLNSIVEIGLVPVFYHKDVEVAKRIVAACVAGGARAVEFTNRSDSAFQVFGELSQHLAKNKAGSHSGSRDDPGCTYSSFIYRQWGQLCRWPYPERRSGTAVQSAQDCL